MIQTHINDIKSILVTSAEAEEINREDANICLLTLADIYTDHLAALEAAVKEKAEEIGICRLEFQKIGIALNLLPGSVLPSSIIPKIASLTSERDEYRSSSNTQKALLGYQAEVIKKQAAEIKRLSNAFQYLSRILSEDTEAYRVTQAALHK
jgi:hypothetical protein